nr:secreted protein [Thraustotheca clavata]
MCISLLILLTTAANGAVIQDWQTCQANTDTCVSNGFVCCVAPADANSGKTTCRPGGDQCYRPPISDWSTCVVGKDTCASSGWSCCVAPSDVSSGKTTCQPGGTECATPTMTPTPGKGLSFAGANSYFLHTLSSSDRTAILDQLKANGFKTVRIFLSHVWHNDKGSSSIGVNDLETVAVGTYDDRVLSKVDQLMVECVQRGLKLIIAMHDRYALGCWDTDAYVAKYKLPASKGCDTSVNVPKTFYTSSAAQADFDRRLTHILSHPNPHFNNRPWGNLSEAIFGFEPQNESQGHMEDGNNNIPNPSWMCGRVNVIRQHLTSSKILVISGGGTTYATSKVVDYFKCKALDVVSIHSYEGANSNQLSSTIQMASQYNKRVIFEEFGAQGNSKASELASYTQAANNLGLPWMFWQILKPGNPSDFETWTDEAAAWSALKSASQTTKSVKGLYSWPELV